MKTLRFLSLTALATIGLLATGVSALAQVHTFGDGDQPYTPMVSTRTRDEARAEAIGLVAHGGPTYAESDSTARQPFASTLTRDEVRTEAIAARQRGDYVFEGGEWAFRQSPQPAVARPALAQVH